MFGRPGVGKTHVAIAACREALRRGGVAGYYDVAGLVSSVQETYSPHEEGTRRALIEGVARRRLVVLDDLGKEHRSANVDSIVYELVDALYVGRSTLVLCSNLSDAEYRGRYDEAVRSRIAGMCEVVVVRGEDRRRG
jgi:DNA replication protein DnaC